MPTSRAAVALIAIAPIAHAQPADDAEPTPVPTRRAQDAGLDDEPALPFRLQTKARYMQLTDADLDAGGDFNVGRANAKVRFLLPLSRRFLIDTDIGYEYSSYDFSGVGTGIAGIDPWSEVSSVRFRPMGVGVINDDLTILAAPIFDFSGEHGADWDETFRVGALGAVRYQVNERLALGVGVQAEDRFADDPQVYPVFILDWRPTEDLHIRTNDFNLGTGGASGLEALYSLNDRWRVGAGFQVHVREFRLDSSGPAPGGIGREVSVPIYARLDWRVADRLTVSGFAGTFVAGNLELEDELGNEIADESYDPAYGIGIQIQGQF